MPRWVSLLLALIGGPRTRTWTRLLRRAGLHEKEKKSQRSHPFVLFALPPRSYSLHPYKSNQSTNLTTYRPSYAVLQIDIPSLLPSTRANTLHWGGHVSVHDSTALGLTEWRKSNAHLCTFPFTLLVETCLFAHLGSFTCLGGLAGLGDITVL